MQNKNLYDLTKYLQLYNLEKKIWNLIVCYELKIALIWCKNGSLWSGTKPESLWSDAKYMIWYNILIFDLVHNLEFLDLIQHLDLYHLVQNLSLYDLIQNLYFLTDYFICNSNQPNGKFNWIEIMWSVRPLEYLHRKNTNNTENKIRKKTCMLTCTGFRRCVHTFPACSWRRPAPPQECLAWHHPWSWWCTCSLTSSSERSP